MKQFHAERAVVKEVINIEKFLLRHSAYIKPTNNSRHQPRKKSADKNCSPFYGIRPHTLRMKSFITILLDLTPKELKKKKKNICLLFSFFRLKTFTIRKIPSQSYMLELKDWSNLFIPEHRRTDPDFLFFISCSTNFSVGVLSLLHAYSDFHVMATTIVIVVCLNIVLLACLQ